MRDWPHQRSDFREQRGRGVDAWNGRGHNHADRRSQSDTGTASSAGTGTAETSGGTGATTGRVYYVSPNGSDSNAGTSVSAPFKTLGYAASLTQPGDTVEALSGSYGSFEIDRSGTAAAEVVFEAAPGASASIQLSATDTAGIRVSAGTSYVTIQGFDIGGNSQSVTLSEAQAAQSNKSDPLTNEVCLAVGAEGAGTTHHIVVRGNTLHDCTLGGYASQFSDYLTVANNVIYGNSFYSPWAGSGLSHWELTDIDSNTGTKIVVSGNIIYGNQNLIADQADPGVITDGEGIIIDDNKKTQSTNLPYGGRTLIVNNVVYGNGSSGIQVSSSQHADVVNNTAFHNAGNLEWAGEINIADANDVNAYNNILDATSGQATTANNGANQNLSWDYNLEFGGDANDFHGAHDVQADPLFVNPSAANFQLQAGSPAIGAGTSQLAPSADLLGNPRSGAVTLGAY